MRINDNTPCRDCTAPKRHPGCHDRCPEYAAFRKEADELKHKRFMAKLETYGPKTTATVAFRNGKRGI